MSTRSSIAVELPSGAVRAVYCHFDGYIDGVGKALVALGDLSGVAGQVRAYHRDMGESWEDVKPKEYADAIIYRATVGKEIHDNGYRYFWTAGAWHVWGGTDGSRPVRSLLEAVPCPTCKGSGHVQGVKP